MAFLPFLFSFLPFFSKMVVTPRFSLRQDDDFVMVDMRVPGHVKLGEDDVYMEGKVFMFHAHPYFLRFVPFAHTHTHTHTRTDAMWHFHAMGLLLRRVGGGLDTAWSCRGTWCRTARSTPSLTARTTG